LREFIEKYKDIQVNERLEDKKECLAGRIMVIRSSSNKLVFFDIHNDNVKVQLMCDMRQFASPEEYRAIVDKVRGGDWIGVPFYLFCSFFYFKLFV
jgi:lysyl-tRNA synthetase class 2